MIDKAFQQYLRKNNTVTVLDKVMSKNCNPTSRLDNRGNDVYTDNCNTIDKATASSGHP